MYSNPALTTEGGVYGTPEQVRERLEALVDMGVTHLQLNPVTRYTEQVEALAEVVGLFRAVRQKLEGKRHRAKENTQLDKCAVHGLDWADCRRQAMAHDGREA